MGDIEALNFLKKSLGIVIKRLETTGVLALPSFLDHSFRPSIDVGDAEVEVPLSAMLYKLKVTGDYPVYFNVDRHITDEEYSVVWPGSYKVIPRRGSTLYLKAPAGFKTRVMVEALEA
jgi:hypothetical protein